jgi:hypothetical protein
MCTDPGASMYTTSPGATDTACQVVSGCCWRKLASRRLDKFPDSTVANAESCSMAVRSCCGAGMGDTRDTACTGSSMWEGQGHPGCCKLLNRHSNDGPYTEGMLLKGEAC